MPGFLTTHVLDTANGKPAVGMEIELARFENGGRRPIKTVRTNDDGRTNEPLLSEDEFETGTYEIVFSVGEYFGESGVPPFLDRGTDPFRHLRPRLALPRAAARLALVLQHLPGELRWAMRRP